MAKPGVDLILSEASPMPSQEVWDRIRKVISIDDEGRIRSVETGLVLGYVFPITPEAPE